MDWQQLIDESALASFLPSESAGLARPVKEALVVFLAGLREERQAEILAGQAGLSPLASFAERLGKLAQSCPVLHKLGQVLARDQRLAPELRDHLRGLESLAPSVPLEEIEATLEQELGPLDRRGIVLEPPALAEASVAMVVPFRYVSYRRTAEAVDSGLVSGVLKVLKPGIEQRLNEELELLERVGAHLDQRCEEFGIPRLDYEEAFQQVREKLAQEVRLDEEQRHLARAREFYAHDPRVQIPVLLEDCTPRVTAMQRVTGDKITEHRGDEPQQRRRTADLVVQALLAAPFFAEAESALVHGDPHAGNLFLTDDGRLAILDWSLVGALDKGEREALVQILLAGITLDAARIAAVLEELDQSNRLDRAALLSIVRQHVARIRHGEMPGIGWLVAMLDDAVQKTRLRLNSDMVLFRKSLHTLEGVLADLGADARQVDQCLIAQFVAQFARELPQRWWASPASRRFATHLSNLDLNAAVLTLPLAAARFWIAESHDLFTAPLTSSDAPN